MKITHNKEHCFLAIWALQHGGPRVADADRHDENDDARGSKKAHSHGHLPKEIVRKIVGYLLKTYGHKDNGIAIQNLELEFDLAVSVCDLIEGVLRTKSHKGENWYEMYGKVSINSTEDAVFLDLDFDYGS